MSLTQLFAVLRASRWSILLMTLMSMAAAFAFASTLPKEYTAKARVLLDVGGSDTGAFASVRRDSIDNYVSTQIRLVGDAAVTRAVVKQLGWDQNPSVIDAWQQDTAGTVDLIPWAANRLTGNLAARQLQDSAVIEIFYSAGSPDVAKQIVGMVRGAYIDNSTRLRMVAAANAAKWNREQAARALVEFQRAQQARLDYAKANGLVLDRRGQTAAMAELSKSTEETVKLPRAATLVRKGPTASMIVAQARLNSVEQTIALLASRGGAANPDYQMAIGQQAVLKAQLAREGQEALRQDGINAAATSEMRAQADQQYVKARLAILGQSTIYDHLVDLERAVAIKQKIYQAAVARAVQFEQVAAAPPTMKVVGDVIGDDDPSFPNIPLIVGIAAGFGLMLGVAITLFGEMLGQRVRGSEDLAFSTKVPVLAVIPAGGGRRKRERRWPFAARRKLGGFQPAE